MAAENRCQGFYWLRIYHLTDGAICAPLVIFKTSLLLTSILSAFSTQVLAKDWIYDGSSQNIDAQVYYNTYFNDNVNKPPLLNSFNELKVPIIKRKCMRKKEMYKIAVI